MGFARTAGVGLIASATTMAARRTARSALHRRTGEPRLPRAARQRSIATILILAVGAGALLALADVLQEQRKQAAREGTEPR